MELKAKAPPLVYRFMIQRLKSMSILFHASEARYNFGHHVNIQLIKIPTSSYANATLRRWGHDFRRNMGEIIQALELIMLIQVSKGEPVKLLTTLFVFCAQSFISSRSG